MDGGRRGDPPRINFFTGLSRKNNSTGKVSVLQTLPVLLRGEVVALPIFDDDESDGSRFKEDCSNPQPFQAFIRPVSDQN